jgi:hypothetical protein
MNAGDLLDVVGFPAIGDTSAILEDAVTCPRFLNH